MKNRFKPFMMAIFALLFAFAFVSCKTEAESDPTYYTVSFNSDGGTSVASQTVESGKTAVEPKSPTKDGYTFPNGTTAQAFSTSQLRLRRTSRSRRTGRRMPSRRQIPKRLRGLIPTRMKIQAILMRILLESLMIRKITAVAIMQKIRPRQYTWSLST